MERRLAYKQNPLIYQSLLYHPRKFDCLPLENQ